MESIGKRWPVSRKGQQERKPFQNPRAERSQLPARGRLAGPIVEAEEGGWRGAPVCGFAEVGALVGSVGAGHGERGGAQPHPGELGPENRTGKQIPGVVGFEDVLNRDTVDLRQRGIYLSFRRETLEHVCVQMKIIQEREKNKQTR